MAQVSVTNKRILQVLALFLAYSIVVTPQAAGEQTRAFFDWVLDQGSNVKVFVDSAVSDPPPS